MSLTLVVLAAGMGSRYGGLKQIDPVGPAGETVLDYAVFDAVRAGFDRVVFVIRRDFEALFREKIGARYAGKVAVDYAFQAVDALPAGIGALPGREKPWGTGHAVWCAREAVKGPFAVINADDFYGTHSFQRLATFLRNPGVNPARAGAGPAARYAMVGFQLANTLSEHGSVSRGVCSLGTDGHLIGIVEQTSIAPADVGPGRRFSGNEVVSMNCWGFTPDLFVKLEAQLREFLAAAAVGGKGDPLKAEFYLPAAVATLIQQGQATVTVLPTTSSWFGVTYREDKPRVTAAIADLVSRGEYPKTLF